jgi:hypothetical protein
MRPATLFLLLFLANLWNWCNNILFKAFWRFSNAIFTKFGGEKINKM